MKDMAVSKVIMFFALTELKVQWEGRQANNSQGPRDKVPGRDMVCWALPAGAPTEAGRPELP